MGAACIHTPPVRNTRLVAELDHLDGREGDVVRARLAADGAKATSGGRMVLPTGLPPRASLRDVCQQVQTWHDRILVAQKDRNGARPDGVGVEIRLNYRATQAETDSVAYIRIEPQPRGASLFIETPIPGLEKHRNKDGSVQLNDPPGKPDGFRMAVPFSFIRKNTKVLFRTELDGMSSEFTYDLDTEKQTARSRNPIVRLFD